MTRRFPAFLAALPLLIAAAPAKSSAHHAAHAATAPSAAVRGHLLFSRDGLICTATPDGKDIRAVTSKRQQITDLLVSPSGKYVAYQVLTATKSIASFQGFEHEVTIATLPDLKMKDVLTSGKGDPSIDRWTPEDLLVCYRGSDRDTRPVITDPELGEIARYSPELYSSTDKARLAWMDVASGAGLVYITTSDIKTLVGARPVAFDLSPDGRRAAYLYTTDEGDDVVIVHDLVTGERAKIYSVPEARKDHAAIAWDRKGERLGYFNGDVALVFDEPPEPFEPWTFNGWRPSWGEGRDLYTVDKRGLVRYDVAKETSQVLIPGAEFGQYVPNSSR